jgi:hypothetical protein
VTAIVPPRAPDSPSARLADCAAERTSSSANVTGAQTPIRPRFRSA